MIPNQWTKSAASVGDGHCVEVVWKMSSACTNGTCVEVGMKKKEKSLTAHE